MKKFILLSILSVFALSMTYAQGDEAWYSSKWESVFPLNSKSVIANINTIEEIYNQSLTDKNQYQQLKAYDYLIKLKSSINNKDRDMLVDSLIRMENLFADVELSSFYRLVLRENNP